MLLAMNLTYLGVIGPSARGERLRGGLRAVVVTDVRQAVGDDACPGAAVFGKVNLKVIGATEKCAIIPYCIESQGHNFPVILTCLSTLHSRH